MANFVHEGEKATDFPLWKSLTGKPGQVIAGQVSYAASLILSKRHLSGNQKLQIFRVQSSFLAWTGVPLPSCASGSIVRAKSAAAKA